MLIGGATQFKIEVVNKSNFEKEFNTKVDPFKASRTYNTNTADRNDLTDNQILNSDASLIGIENQEIDIK